MVYAVCFFIFLQQLWLRNRFLYTVAFQHRVCENGRGQELLFDLLAKMLNWVIIGLDDGYLPLPRQIII